MPGLSTSPPRELAPMLARLVRELPEGDYIYEPKWDGFRCLAVRDGDRVELRSRHGRPLTRYFPELVSALAARAPERWVIDGEIVLAVEGRLDFEALMARVHPAASRVRELAARCPATFVAFDLPCVGSENLCERGFAHRRERLSELLADAGARAFVTPATQDRAVAARWLEEFCGGGLDGVMAKPRELPYRPGARAMLKVKHERTAECVVAGVRVAAAAATGEVEVSSLMLGLWGEGGALEHVGVASSFSRATRRDLARDLAPLASSIEGHPWEQGFLLGGGAMGRLKGAAGRWMPGMTMDWVPLAPERVAEVSYTQVDRRRLRHPAKLVRWRPDREPGSCAIDQLDAPAPQVPKL